MVHQKGLYDTSNQADALNTLQMLVMRSLNIKVIPHLKIN